MGAAPSKRPVGAFLDLRHTNQRPSTIERLLGPFLTLTGGIGGVVPDDYGCLAALKLAPGTNAGYAHLEPLAVFAP